MGVCRWCHLYQQDYQGIQGGLPVPHRPRLADIHVAREIGLKINLFRSCYFYL